MLLALCAVHTATGPNTVYPLYDAWYPLKVPCATASAQPGADRWGAIPIRPREGPDRL